MAASGTGSGAVAQVSAQTDEIVKATSDLDKMRQYFAAQPKETIRVPKDRGEQFVQVNGYSFAIAPGIPVSVPKQIAEMLREAEVI